MKNKGCNKPASKPNIEAGNEISPCAQELSGKKCSNEQNGAKKKRSIDRNCK
ncbi:MAG TPA: hypothetical protein GXX14_07320 [Clostridiaceae bacterium]|nr:hypothetical protein [Clostridiaceae bacterium]